jgi:hypothetical protein
MLITLHQNDSARNTADRQIDASINDTTAHGSHYASIPTQKKKKKIILSKRRHQRDSSHGAKQPLSQPTAQENVVVGWWRRVRVVWNP